MSRPTLLVSALTDHRATSREQALLEALQGSVLSSAVATWDVRLHIADSDPRLPERTAYTASWNLPRASGD